jgi:hypothetical protein
MLTHARRFVAAGLVGMQSGGARWQESGRAEMAMRARTPGGPGGPLGGCDAVVRVRGWSLVGRACPLAGAAGAAGMQLAGFDGWA